MDPRILSAYDSVPPELLVAADDGQADIRPQATEIAGAVVEEIVAAEPLPSRRVARKP